ncbi:hypothetical protein C8R46DRAFT_1035791 [Mycena filopes]|nr:hypothetical protein C8R46DRAFT_1035791 [Mycena filopes]
MAGSPQLLSSPPFGFLHLTTSSLPRMSLRRSGRLNPRPRAPVHGTQLKLAASGSASPLRRSVRLRGQDHLESSLDRPLSSHNLSSKSLPHIRRSSKKEGNPPRAKPKLAVLPQSEVARHIPPRRNEGVKVISNSAPPDYSDLEFDIIPLKIQSYRYSTGQWRTDSNETVEFTVWGPIKKGSQRNIHLVLGLLSFYLSNVSRPREGWYRKVGRLASLAIKELRPELYATNSGATRDETVLLEASRLAECFRLWVNFKNRCQISGVAIPLIEILPTYLLKREGLRNLIGQPWITEGTADSLNPDDPTGTVIRETLISFSHFTYLQSNYANAHGHFQVPYISIACLETKLMVLLRPQILAQFGVRFGKKGAESFGARAARIFKTRLMPIEKDLLIGRRVVAACGTSDSFEVFPHEGEVSQFSDGRDKEKKNGCDDLVHRFSGRECCKGLAQKPGDCPHGK